jgi:hypothetical protein
MRRARQNFVRTCPSHEAIPMPESLMTDRQDPHNDSSQLADEHTVQGAAPAANIDSASHADRRDTQRRSVGYGWSAAGATLVI